MDAARHLTRSEEARNDLLDRRSGLVSLVLVLGGGGGGSEYVCLLVDFETAHGVVDRGRDHHGVEHVVAAGAEREVLLAERIGTVALANKALVVLGERLLQGVARELQALSGNRTHGEGE